MEFSKKHLLAHLAYGTTDKECTEENITEAFISTERGLREFNKNKDLLAAQQQEEESLAQLEAAKASASAGGSFGPPPLRLSDPNHHVPDNSGTCAIAAIIKDGHLIIANAGDCTALLIKKDGSFQVLNSLHRPVLTLTSSNSGVLCTEGVRIYEAGLCVQQNRVNGELAVSRSIGDFSYKGLFEEEQKHAVTCAPTITRTLIMDDFKCLYLYSDGIGDGMEPTEIAEYESANSHLTPREKMHALLNACMQKTRDNATIARIDF
jgi:serine/threonine protein phosphatase PrpC